VGRLVAQSVEHLTLGFGSGRDLMVVALSLAWSSVPSVKSAWDPLCLPPLKGRRGKRPRTITFLRELRGLVLAIDTGPVSITEGHAAGQE